MSEAPAPPPVATATAAPAPPPVEAAADPLEVLAYEGYLWGFAIVENYKALYAYSVHVGGPEYKAPFNKIANTARVYTPADKVIITPNSWTPSKRCPVETGATSEDWEMWTISV